MSRNSASCRPDTVTTTGTAWGGASEIITLKSGDRRRRNELADRAKHLRILQNYGLQPPSQNRKAGRDSHRGGSKDREAGDYDDDGFEGEVSTGTTFPHIIAYQHVVTSVRAVFTAQSQHYHSLIVEGATVGLLQPRRLTYQSRHVPEVGQQLVLANEHLHSDKQPVSVFGGPSHRELSEINVCQRSASPVLLYHTYTIACVASALRYSPSVRHSERMHRRRGSNC